MGELPLQALAVEGPTICGQVLLALQSDLELDRLLGRGQASGRESSAPSRRLSALLGATDAASMVGAVEALRGMLWAALTDELGPSGGERAAARRVADLSDRLAYVCACVLESTLSAQVSEPAGGGSEREPEGQAPRRARAETPRVSAAVMVDERELEPDLTSSEVPSQAPVAVAAPPEERPLSWDESPPVPPRRSFDGGQPSSWEDPVVAPFAEIEIRDERVEAGPAAWIGSIGRELDRFALDGRPFVVLLLEPDDIERLRETPEELAAIDATLERVLTQTLSSGTDIALAPAELRPSLTRQSPGRYWLLIPHAARPAGERLATRVHQALGSAVAHRARRLEVSIGIALCPEDGRDAPALAAHADVSLYAARSAARLARSRAHASVDEQS